MGRDTLFSQRLSRHYDELKWLYCELYEGGIGSFGELCSLMERRSLEREEAFRQLDREREEDTDWYRRNDMAGMMMYTDAFAGTLQGVREKLDYITECGVRCLHLMPLLDSPAVNNDGGYAVSDFTKVKESLGTMADLKELALDCHGRGISLCLDFVMNHTSEEHEWARRARAGEKEYRDRYFFFDSFDVPSLYEQTCPQVFPTTAPGNFTWLEDAQSYVMTTFYPYQWDLNYANPLVFNTMVDYLLNLANHGVDVVRIDAVPYIWKELGTSCRNLPQVHTIVRMMRMICETVCPGVLLLGEVVMEPARVVPYFGTVEKPECHMLYNVTTMASVWHTLATRKVSLLKHQLDVINALPGDYVFLNYLRCHDDIGWGLEYDWLWKEELMEEVPHKKYLNAYFTGQWPGSAARGELYNDDPASGDARLCGTTASLCGLETAEESGDAEAISRAVDCDLMLHACMMTLSGIPMLYSGDEIGALNDYSYREDAAKAADSRYVHRGSFPWKSAELRGRQGSTEQRLFAGITELIRLRKRHAVFLSAASVRTVDTSDPAVLCLVRELDGEKLTAVFNFSEEPRTAWIREGTECIDLLSGARMKAENVPLGGYQARWLLQRKAGAEE